MISTFKRNGPELPSADATIIKTPLPPAPLVGMELLDLSTSNMLRQPIAIIMQHLTGLCKMCMRSRTIQLLTWHMDVPPDLLTCSSSIARREAREQLAIRLNERIRSGATWNILRDSSRGPQQMSSLAPLVLPYYFKSYHSSYFSYHPSVHALMTDLHTCSTRCLQAAPLCSTASNVAWVARRRSTKGSGMLLSQESADS